MKVFQAIFLGLIQGLTEFLPVSSSGHLAFFKAVFNVEETGILFDVLLHFATLVSICLVFYKDILKLILEFVGICKDVVSNIVVFFKNITGSDAGMYSKIIVNPYRKFVVLLIVSTIPTGILGILLDDVIDFVSANLIVTGISFLCTGAILMISDYVPEKGKRLKEANYGDAFCIGVSQGLATLPGISRSGTTITACLLCGFDRKFAAKYSFIMSIPAVLGALILELTHISEQSVTGSDVGCYILGMIIAGIIGYIALRITMKLVLSKFFKYISFYCFLMGLVSFITFIIKLK